MTAAPVKNGCPACGRTQLESLLRVAGMPVNACTLTFDAQSAKAYPTGDIDLTLCLSCGLLFNAAFDESLCRYDGDYEETQGYSPTFRRYLEGYAHRFVEHYGLQGGRVLEIGCGKGDFLALLADAGVERAVGYDPAFDPDRHPAPGCGTIEFNERFFTDADRGELFDATICRMTLEHVPDIHGFLRLLGSTCFEDRGLVHLQVPNADFMLEHDKYCDLVYEHCNYFTETALRRAAEAAALQVVETVFGYEGQHLSLTARPSVDPPPPDGAAVSEQERGRMWAFAQGFKQFRKGWLEELADCRRKGQRVVIWGSGSKATSFLSILGDTGPIVGLVDINPHKAGSYALGSGLVTLEPTDLIRAGSPIERPDMVIIMNPIYRTEIKQKLRELGLDPELESL